MESKSARKGSGTREVDISPAPNNPGNGWNRSEAANNSNDAWASTFKQPIDARKDPLVKALLTQDATPGHIKALDQLLADNVRMEVDNGLEDTVNRFIDSLQAYLDKRFKPGNYTLKKFGSFLVGLYDREVHSHNLNLYVESNANYRGEKTLGSLFEELFDALKHASDEIPCLEKKVVKLGEWILPAIGCSVLFPECDLNVLLCIGDQARNVLLSSRLLYAYSVILPHLKPLALFMRKWATILRLNGVVCGGFSNYLMDVMVVFYLQQRGHLPVLHELLDDEEKAINPVESLVDMPPSEIERICKDEVVPLFYKDGVPQLNVGSLLKDLFSYFAVEVDLTTITCKIDRRRMEMREFSHNRPQMSLLIKDPTTGWNVGRLRVELFYEFMNCLLATTKTLCIPRTSNGPIHIIKFDSQSDGTSCDVDDVTVTIESRMQPYLDEPSYVPVYSMQRSFLAPGVSGMPAVVCNVCGRTHREVDCTRANAHVPLSGQALSEDFCSKLAGAIERLFEQRALTAEREARIRTFVESNIEKVLQKELNEPDLKLTLFGSLANGFGHNNCDLDLCMRIGDEFDFMCEDVSPRELLSNVVYFLSSQLEVELIAGARVPIVKFSSEKDNFRGDISLYNTLALQNTNLMKAYADFDARVPPLGMAVKHWARLFHINDASEGTVSSYAYLIMLIAYLQRCNPPVLPYFQENIPFETRRRVVDGWDITYCTDVNKGPYSNKRGLGELLYGFFRYYASFDFDNEVVQIRRKSRLYKIDKDWHLSRMCVEDPFELEHNLTSGVKVSGVANFVRCLEYTVKGLQLLDKEGPDDGEEELTLESLIRFIPEFGGTAGRRRRQNQPGRNRG